MPRQLVAKARFLRAYHQLSDADQCLVDAALRRFEHYLRTGDAPAGLGVKHFGGRTYEFRAGLALLGTHDDVRRFLKSQ